MVHPAFRPLLKKNYWNLLSRNSRNVSVLFEFHLPNGLRDISEHRERRRRSIAARWCACHLPSSTVVVKQRQDHALAHYPLITHGTLKNPRKRTRPPRTGGPFRAEFGNPAQKRDIAISPFGRARPLP